jgi:TonB family protein
MSQQRRFKLRKPRHHPMATRRLAVAFAPSAQAAGAAAADFPGVAMREPESSRRTWLTGGMASALHLGAIAILFYLASLAPELAENIIEVQLLKNEPEVEEPAPAPMALAERRLPNFAPQVQSVAPQIVNPRVIADAAPAINAEALQMDAVASVVAPTQIRRSSAPVVERVSAVISPIHARASRVDVPGVAGPAVRGPVKVDAPVGPSVGPRQVTVASTGRSFGTGKLAIGGDGSSVREGQITGRDVVGTPTGAPLVSIDTAVGEGLLRGSGGEGTGLGPATKSARDCLNRAEVRNYIDEVQRRTLDRWILPPGVPADQKVTLRFQLDVAGSATHVSLISASDNALGASAVDALRAAAPFAPMPDPARCLARVPIVATFTNPIAG